MTDQPGAWECSLVKYPAGVRDPRTNASGDYDFRRDMQLKKWTRTAAIEALAARVGWSS